MLPDQLLAAVVLLCVLRVFITQQGFTFCSYFVEFAIILESYSRDFWSEGGPIILYDKEENSKKCSLRGAAREAPGGGLCPLIAQHH